MFTLLHLTISSLLCCKWLHKLMCTPMFIIHPAPRSLQACKSFGLELAHFSPACCHSRTLLCSPMPYFCGAILPSLQHQGQHSHGLLRLHPAPEISYGPCNRLTLCFSVLTKYPGFAGHHCRVCMQPRPCSAPHKASNKDRLILQISRVPMVLPPDEGPTEYIPNSEKGGQVQFASLC